MSTPDGHSLFAARCAELPAVLRDALDRPPPALPPGLADARRWVVTATGGSEAPARLFAWMLRRHAGRAAEFAPLSSFAAGAAPGGDALAVFTQGVSPNARLALARCPRWASSLVVTAAPLHADIAAAAEAGAAVCAHPPDDEPELLVRVQGPAAATLTAWRVAERLAACDGRPRALAEAVLDALPERVAAAFAEAREAAESLPLTRPLAFIALPDGGPEAAHGLRWKWLEAVGTCDPPVWDVLQFAHGPWQHVVERPYTLVALERPDVPGGRELVDRLASMLDPGRHALVRLRATLPGVGAFFEHDARVNALACAALARAGRDLVRWPGRGTDGALYGVGPGTLQSTSTRASADE